MTVGVRKAADDWDWWVIERDGERISDAAVEGTAEEMLAIAEAIENGHGERWRRCAIRQIRDGYEIWSPRNTLGRYGKLTPAEAKELAADIRAKCERERTGTG